MQVPINGDYRYSVATMNAHVPNTFMSPYGMPNSRSSLPPSMDAMLLHTMVSAMPLNGGFMNQAGTLDYTMPNGTPDALQHQRPMSSFVAPTIGDYYHPGSGGQNPEAMPLDGKIIEATRRILATSDLTTMTKNRRYGNSWPKSSTSIWLAANTLLAMSLI
ncbi:hypothetical protein H4S07_000237 [Coemansia furcata]|uniref:Uncharacterized protein n=1 Tax=Coemansia furcata TaxID=417177 RepID=A0ACC1LRS0_9FUNG|nr:hypothetical protein H4S07_000237 [Coemansia furcata]